MSSADIYLLAGGASFSLQHRLQPVSGVAKKRRLKPTLQAEARATQ